MHQVKNSRKTPFPPENHILLAISKYLNNYLINLVKLIKSLSGNSLTFWIDQLKIRINILSLLTIITGLILVQYGSSIRFKKFEIIINNWCTNIFNKYLLMLL